MWNAEWDDKQDGIKIVRRNITNIRYADDTTLMEESRKEIKSLLVKEKGEKAGLKLSIQKMNFMAFGPVTSWQIYEGKVDIMTDFIFLGSKITSNSDCSHEIKRRLLLGKKTATNLAC